MKKISIIFNIILLSIIFTLLIFNNNDNHTKYIEYNEHKFTLSVNGENVTTMPSGNYFLASYDCTNGTELNWDYQTSTLTTNNPNVSDTCSLTFISPPSPEFSPTLYDLTNIGDYIAYTGDNTNGCTGLQCSGFNANQSESSTEEDTYGYCHSNSYKFLTYGWRVLYKDDNSVYIISAGAPECITGSSSTIVQSNKTINNLNELSLKYCNFKYLSNGICDETTAHQFNNSDFTFFTAQYYGTESSLSEKINNISLTNNDIINNGGYYWFAHSEKINWNQSYTYYWNPYHDLISYTKENIKCEHSSMTRAMICTTNNGTKTDNEYTNGLRPVLKLDASIKATGGSGTMSDPYTISERTTE